MKFPYSVLHYVISEDIDWDDLDELPFEVDENADYDEVCQKLDEYFCEHAIETVKHDTVYCDLEKAYEKLDVVFTFDGKYYGFEYRYSPYNGYYDIPCDEDLPELIPVEVKTIVYKKKDE